MTVTEYPESIKKRIESLKTDNISERNKELILKFVEDAYTKGLGYDTVGELRVVKYFGQLKNIAIWLEKDFDKTEKPDIEKVISKINISNYADWTKWSYKVMIKLFWKWLEGDNEDYPDKVKWIRRQKKPSTKVTPKDLITRGELKEIINACDNTRDRCLCALLYESGARIGELLNVNINDLNFNSDHAKLTMLTEKINRPRTIPIVESVPYITEWLRSHPINKPDSPLFVNLYKKANGYQRIGKDSVYQLMKNISNQVNRGRKLYPHLFRHSRASELAPHFKEAQMCYYFGWSQGSRMPGTYYHLSGVSVDGTYLFLYGKEKAPQQIQEKFEEITCIRCDKKSLPTDKQCANCGLVFSEGERFKQFKKDKVTRFVIQKVWDKRPELKRMVDEISKEFSDEIENMLE